MTTFGARVLQTTDTTRTVEIPGFFSGMSSIPVEGITRMNRSGKCYTGSVTHQSERARDPQG